MVHDDCKDVIDGVMVIFLEGVYMTAFVIIFFICPTGSLNIQCHEAKISWIKLVDGMDPITKTCFFH
jgi:hypothetical protein